MITYYLWFIIFAVVAYAVAVDSNVAKYVDLFIQGAWITIRRYYYMAIMHPKNPITNWIMERKMAKLARELHKELVENREDELNNWELPETNEVHRELRQ